MNRFKNILVVVDDPTTSYAALARGVQLAKRNSARLTVVHAFEGPRQGILSALEGISVRELEEFEYEARLSDLKELVSGRSTRGIEVEVKLLVGTPFIEIVREVLRGGHDLVLKDAPRRGELSGQLFTSLDLHLMRKCPCPLWMVRFSRKSRYRRVIAAVDTEAEDTEQSSLSHKVLDLAAAVARLDGSELHVVHAWQFYGETALRAPRYGLSPARVEVVVEGYRTRVAAMMEAMVRGYHSPDLVPHVHLIKGEPAPTLARGASAPWGPSGPGHRRPYRGQRVPHRQHRGNGAERGELLRSRHQTRRLRVAGAATRSGRTALDDTGHHDGRIWGGPLGGASAARPLSCLSNGAHE